MNKLLILCADDYGQNEPISQGIFELVRLQRITAVSCLTNLPNLFNYAKWLLPYQNQIDIGLHFNLTHGATLCYASSLNHKEKFPKLNYWLVKSRLRNIDKEAIAQEFKAQLIQFREAYQKLPDFIDGHQHIHQLPVIREIILNVCSKIMQGHDFYIRNTSEPYRQLFKGPARFKRSIIQLSGSHSLRKILTKKQIKHNSSFSGYYNFRDASHYSNLFPRFLANITHGGLIMCHPGLKSNDMDDPIRESRVYEYEYFKSQKFLHDLGFEGIKLSQFNKT